MRPRIRSIKPEVLSDDELWDLEQATSLPLYRAFTGLWMFVDREGRFEWKPRRLGAVVLPFWTGDFEEVLNALVRGRFLVRYEVAGKAYAVVRTFKRHQKVNHREAESELPPPPNDLAPTPPGRARAGCVTRDDAAEAPGPLCPGTPGGKGKEGKENGKGEGARHGHRADTQTTARSLSVVFTEAEMRETFQATFRSLRRQSPNMRGNPGDLHARVLDTADARGVEASALFKAAVHLWATGDLNDRELSAPYACFAAAWGQLVERVNGKPKDKRGELAQRSAEALKRGDQAEYKAAEAELEELLAKEQGSAP